MARLQRRREKRFSYSDRLGRQVQEHARHWDGFTFRAGAVVVGAEGIWGSCQVWAASVEEGKRVIRHGLLFGGFDPDDPEQGEWVIGQADGDWHGRPGTFRTAVTRRGLMVSKRDGSAGAPEEVWPELKWPG